MLSEGSVTQIFSAQDRGSVFRVQTSIFLPSGMGPLGSRSDEASVMRLQRWQVPWSLLSVQAVLVVTREPGKAGGKGSQAQKHPGAFSLDPGDRGRQAVGPLCGAEQCLHFIPLLLLCVVCLVNSRRQRFKSRMAAPLLQFGWLVFVTQSP